MKNKCERKEGFLKEGCPGERVEGENGVDRAAMKSKAEDSLEKLKDLTGTVLIWLKHQRKERKGFSNKASEKCICHW